MPATTTYEPGQILVVDYRHTDGSPGGRRPVVVLSTKAYNRSAPDVIVAQISSQLRQLRLAGSVRVGDWRGAGLLQESIVKPVITTYHRDDIVKSIGHLTKQDWLAVKIAIAQVLGFRRAPATF